VATEVGDGDAEPGIDEGCDDVAPGAAQIAHSGDRDDQRAVPRDGVGDATLRAGEEADGAVWSTALERWIP